MKNTLTNLFNSSIFHHVPRVVIVCICLSVSVSVFAGQSESKMVVSTRNDCAGMGLVYVGAKGALGDFNDPDTYKSTYDATMSSSLEKVHYYILYARPNNGYCFVGWTKDSEGSNIASYNNPYEKSIYATSSDKSNPTTETYYALFRPVSVTSVENPLYTISTTDLRGTGQCNISFNVSDADSPEDFTYLATGEGFVITEAIYADNKVTLTVQYTDQNIHGTGIAESTVKLTSRGDPTSTESTTVKVNSDLTPTFTKPADYNFGEIYVNDQQSSDEALYVVTKNNAASQAAPVSTGQTGASWTASLSGTNSNQFKLVNENPQYGAFEVIYKPTEVGTHTATLSISVTYTDAKGTPISSGEPQIVTLTGQAEQPIISAIVFNPTAVDFNEQVTGYTGSQKVTVSQQNVANVEYSWGETNAANVFSYTAIAGAVTISANPTAPGTYTATLTATGDDTRDGQTGNKTKGTLPVSISVGLQSPILVGGSNLKDTHYLKWTKVPCATAYQVYEVNGSTKTSVLTYRVTEDATHITHSIAASADKIYEVEAISTYGGGNYTSLSNQWQVDHDAIAIGSTPYLDLYTGTEKNSTTYPYRPKEKVDLSATFDAEGNALFDKLYVFGLTTASGGGTELTVATYYSPGVAPNAVTPCYIYQKTNGGMGYTLESTIANMNVSDKPLSDFKNVNGKKLYFTGHCPYGSNGYAAGKKGVVYVEGAAGEKVDIYIQDLTLHGRMHTQSGYLPTDLKTFEEIDRIVVQFNVLSAALGGDTQFLPASASAFVFASTSTNPSQPFAPTIHLMGDNKLDGGTGWILADASAKQMEAGMYSSPIHLFVTDYNQVTNLSIDDLWLVDAEGNTKRTNGKLDLSPKDTNRPSVELGNAYSTLNFNGGQITLKNNLPVAQGTYVSTFAIAMRSLSYDVSVASATLVGMGADQPSGNVNFNDGSFYCKAMTQDEWNNLSCGNYYHSKESLKCPVNTRMNGGTYYCEPYACSGSENKGGSPTNKYDNELVTVKIPINNTPEGDYGLATVDFDAFATSLVCQIEGHPDFDITMAQYYQGKETYGRSSLKAADDQTVTFMVPYQFTNKEIVQEVENISWAVTLPVIGGSLGGVETTMGGSTTVESSEYKRTANLLCFEVDQYALDVTNPEKNDGYQYTTPSNTVLAPINNIEMGFMEEGVYQADVENEDPYLVAETQYMLKPIAFADKWILFSPPFDVTNVYIVEAYNEELLVEMAENNNEDAYMAQAKAMVDLGFYLGFFAVFQKATIPFWNMYYYWLADPNIPQDEKGRGAILLNHFTGKNYDAHYYLQRSSGEWTWDGPGSRFNTDWQFLPETPEQVDHGGTMYDVVMKKGEIYAMKFPYMYDGYMDDHSWDYWTGKYLIFEGIGPQTIEGTNKHAEILEDMNTAGKAVLRGNATLAKMTVEKDNAYYAKDGNQKFIKSSDEQELYPGEGFLMATPPSMPSMPGRKEAIDMMSGVVTYEGDETSTSTPTIAGSRKLLVYNTNGGLILLPVVPQSVAIYNAAGVLVDNQYITEQTVATLPAGAYFIRGEYDQAKAIVK